MYMYVCVYIHTHIHIHIYVYIYTHPHIYPKWSVKGFEKFCLQPGRYLKLHREVLYSDNIETKAI